VGLQVEMEGANAEPLREFINGLSEWMASSVHSGQRERDSTICPQRGLRGRIGPYILSVSVSLTDKKTKLTRQNAFRKSF